MPTKTKVKARVKFEGKTYDCIQPGGTAPWSFKPKVFPSKKQARKSAKTWRQKGFNARIVKRQMGYLLYAREKKRKRRKRK